jgi:MFS family permease
VGPQEHPARGPRQPTLRQNLRYGAIDGTLYSVMIGTGETYLPLFVLAASLGEVASGLVQTVPYLLGAALQLAAPWGARRFGTLRRWIVFAASMQAAALAPMAIMGLLGRATIWAIFLSAMIYWAASMGCGAAWSTWIGMIVPPPIRARYFAFKSRIGNLATLSGLITGGLVLQAWTGQNEHLWPFAILFLTAGAARGICAYYLHLQSDTGPVPLDHRDVGPAELLRRLRGGRDGRFIAYMVLVQVGVQIGQPFFPPFMRAQLRMDYGQVLALTGAAFVARAAMHTAWGAFAHRYGAGRLLWIGGLGIIPHAALLLVSPSFLYLLLAQLAAGAMWSAYELAVLLLMFEHIREEERTSLWSIFNVLTAAAMVTGSLVGGVLLERFPGWRGYEVIFLLSTVGRLSTALFLRRGGDLPHAPATPAVEVEAVRPGAGSIDRPILPDLPNDRAAG